MNTKLLLNFTLLTGEIMIENGAETSRVEDTLHHILSHSNCNSTNSFAIPTGLFVTIDHPEQADIQSCVRRVKRRGINLNRIALANHISRSYCSDEITLEAAYYQMQKVKEEPEYSDFIRILSISFAAGFFTLVLGGSLQDMSIAFLCGFIFSFLQRYLKRIGLTSFFIDLLGGAIGAAISYIAFYLLGIGDNFDLIVISSIMPMVPGVAITNAIRDTLHGDLLSGMARATDAFIIAASIATGVGISLSILL
ncbi:MAG: threonine/serine exporter family protein [Vallitaleaceae bacterium]|nr:threonine/serine exporter family protein [Vallitaleaceae bacterium]